MLTGTGRVQRPVLVVAAAILLRSSTVYTSSITVRIDCGELRYCEDQFSDRGRRICLAKELVHHLEPAANGCPGLAEQKTRYGVR